MYFDFAQYKQRGLAPILIVILIAALVGGYFVFTSLRGSRTDSGAGDVAISPISSPTPKPVESTPSAETANWKTYTNIRVGFSVKYPNRYGNPSLPSGIGPETLYATGEEDNANIIFGTTSEDSFSIFVFPFSDTLDKLMDSQKALDTRPYNGRQLDQFTTETKDLTVDGINARWLISSYKDGSFISEKHNNIYFVNKNHGFIINTWPDYNSKELNQILSTFKFTQ